MMALARRGIAFAVVLVTLAGQIVAALDENIATSIEEDLKYDRNGKLASHYLLYPAGNPYCPAAKKTGVYGFETRALSGDALHAVFPGAQEGHCLATCVEKGVDRSVAYAVMPYKHYDSAKTAQDFEDWFESTCRNVEVCLMNYHSRETPVKVFWLSPTGEKRFHFGLEFGERNTRCLGSFIGHRFQAEDSETGEVLDTFTVEYVTTKAIGESPPNGNPERHNFDKEIKYSLYNEWRRHNKVKRTFSPLGFKKGRLPDDLFASMGSFYYNNRNYKVREEWEGKGVFVNWWETDCSFIQIPWDLKGYWQNRLRELVEAWAGVPIEQTDMYGLRQYEEGARLLTHVDRESTHAVSLIVNIAQGNLTEPWPVEVNDHGDRLHEIVMEPGDIVYYESAKALHGRNRPLTGKGAYYVNLFTHYRPTGDPKWFEKASHEGVEDPVTDIEGKCQLKRVTTTETIGTKQLGLVEVVECDDKRLGPYLSPSLFQATSGDDLIEWWQRTTPGGIRTDLGSSGRDEL